MHRMHVLVGGPRQLPYGHIFGHDCITTWWDQVRLCPTYRKRFEVTPTKGRSASWWTPELQVDETPVDERSFVSRLWNNLFFIFSLPFFVWQNLILDLEMPEWWQNRYQKASRWAKFIFALSLLFFVIIVAPLSFTRVGKWILKSILEVAMPLIPRYPVWKRAERLAARLKKD
ncbi:hypothetical protein BDZ45DRAFT_418409 [Acephala macrosclerotiorum]|nr:hypothetical protein BDZ45DRAFT_418409 [Acephala macrosclerotiorum]